MCIKTLNEFIDWAAQFKDSQYLFRGVSTKSYKIEASACRRLRGAEKNNPSKLLKINRELIEKARSLGHDQKDGKQLSDLELLAELQHFGAATCLIDFSRNAFVALWFACQTSSDGEANGKVYAVNRGDIVRFKKVTPKLLTKDIDYFLEPNERGEYLIYQWQPKLQNHRIIAQQSEFLFSGARIEEEAKCVIDRDSKQDLLRSLEQISGITDGSIYPDFDGFARLHAHNKQQTEPDARFYLWRGIESQQNDNLDDAISYYSEVISLQPDISMLSIAYASRGFAYFLRREFKPAIKDFTKAIKYKPNDVLIYCSRGTAYSRTREFDLAIKDHTKAIELNPEFSEAYVQRGAAYVENNEVDLALNDYSKAMELTPDDPSILIRQGIAYGKKGEIDPAIKNFDKAIKLNPGFAEAYSTRGAVYIDKKESDLAIEDLTKAIELDPNDTKSYCYRGRAYNEKGDFDKAIDDLTQAIVLDPHLAEAYLNRGNAYNGKEDFDKAISNYTKAIELNPDDADFYCYRGLTYHSKSDLNLAIDNFTKAIELNPRLAEAYLDRGCIYSEIGDFDKALNDFNKLIQLRPNDAQAHYFRGLTHGKKGDLHRAHSDFTKMIEANPDDGNVYYYRGELRLYLRRWEKAKSDLIAAAAKGIDVITQFHQRNGSIANFEEKIGVPLPEDIAALLTPAQI